VAVGGVTVDQIVAHPRLRALASTIMDEASAIANAELVERYGVDQFQPLGAAEKAAMMEWCDGVGEFAPSTLVDFMNGHQMELRYLFQEPILRGRRLAIPCPVLQAVVTQIEILAKTPRQRPAPPCFVKQHQHYGAATSLTDRIPLKSVGQNVLQTTTAVALLLLHTS
jgi:ketopantoate reductase